MSVVGLEVGTVPASAHAAVEAERVYDALVDHIEDCTVGCYPWRDVPWKRDRLCDEGAALVDDYAAAVLAALDGRRVDAGAAVAVRLGAVGQAPRLAVLEGGR